MRKCRKMWWNQRGQKWRHNMAHTLCMLDKQGYTHAHTCTRPRIQAPTRTHMLRERIIFTRLLVTVHIILLSSDSDAKWRTSHSTSTCVGLSNLVVLVKEYRSAEFGWFRQQFLKVQNLLRLDPDGWWIDHRSRANFQNFVPFNHEQNTYYVQFSPQFNGIHTSQRIIIFLLYFIYSCCIAFLPPLFLPFCFVCFFPYSCRNILLLSIVSVTYTCYRVKTF